MREIALLTTEQKNVFCSDSDVNTTTTNTNGEKTLRRAEEEEEEGERRDREESSGGYGAVEAWADQDMDGIGVASQGCVCLACASEIERDGSVFLFICQFRESGCACVRRGKRIEIELGYLRMFIHFDAGIRVESLSLGKER